MRIALTDVERLTLVNQYRILAAVGEKGERDSYARIADELENGYSYFYRDFHNLQEEMSEDDAHFVIEVLSLFHKLQIGYGRLTDKAGIEAHEVVFDGFDGNNEPELLGFTGALIERRQFRDIIGDSPKNSHVPTVEMYRRMLQGWRDAGNPQGLLTAEQIKAILAERVHPSNR